MGDPTRRPYAQRFVAHAPINRRHRNHRRHFPRHQNRCANRCLNRSCRRRNPNRSRCVWRNNRFDFVVLRDNSNCNKTRSQCSVAHQAQTKAANAADCTGRFHRANTPNARFAECRLALVLAKSSLARACGVRRNRTLFRRTSSTRASTK